ncbi:2-hydroxychromene-2-carboxylate isomerase [Rhodobium gokarnense]|uniref:2-hydroxychromene-2-carboxylate isomerase n=1 Tax=Rhodobium gokarnense TaxID=364296 RepID=A0ABT3HFE6_9HYPH|nr:DsbA family protein [Rhodobium gokarnense]MCW2309112.1 2-hydroxychromene-2-carboxylate isomerase [Rhodobium gokarnense]
MSDPADLLFFFNFRSPYCYLVTKSVWDIFEDYRVNLVWKPLGGWNGRSDPDRAKVKIPLVRQDVGRWAKKLGIPYTPPPITTDPTRAGAASLYAEKEGRLRDHVVETMRIEWAEGQDIGDPDVLREVARRIGMDPEAVIAASEDPDNLAVLDENAVEARERGVFGVPTFITGDAIFWGNDRLDFLRDHLREERLRKI